MSVILTQLNIYVMGALVGGLRFLATMLRRVLFGTVWGLKGIGWVFIIAFVGWWAFLGFILIACGIWPFSVIFWLTPICTKTLI